VISPVRRECRNSEGCLHHLGSHFQAFSTRPKVSNSSNIVYGVLTVTRRSVADVFRIQVVSNSDVRSPIVTLGSTSFFHVRTNNVYVLAVTK
jgi:hypothetical protein